MTTPFPIKPVFKPKPAPEPAPPPQPKPQPRFCPQPPERLMPQVSFTSWILGGPLLTHVDSRGRRYPSITIQNSPHPRKSSAPKPVVQGILKKPEEKKVEEEKKGEDKKGEEKKDEEKKEEKKKKFASLKMEVDDDGADEYVIEAAGLGAEMAFLAIKLPDAKGKDDEKPKEKAKDAEKAKGKGKEKEKEKEAAQNDANDSDSSSNSSSSSSASSSNEWTDAKDEKLASLKASNKSWKDICSELGVEKSEAVARWKEIQKSKNEEKGKDRQAAAAANKDKDNKSGGGGKQDKGSKGNDKDQAKDTEKAKHDDKGKGKADEKTDNTGKEKGKGKGGRRLEPDKFWSRNDCETLEMLEGRYADQKWFQLQAGFYNMTGRMVSAQVIQRKFEE